jgi:nucleotide-binding universal stress UspA family protein
VGTTHGHILGDGHASLLAAVDLSPASVSVFDAALEIAHRSPNATIHVLHVRRGAKVAKSDDAIKALADWAEKLPEHGARIELHALEAANAAEAIVSFAAAMNVDVILLGTHGRKGVSRVLLGSVAETVVRTAGCSVFVVREKTHGDGNGNR